MDQRTFFNDAAFYQKSMPIPSLYNNTTSYIALHHHAYDMYVMYIDDIVISSLPLSINEVQDETALNINNPVTKTLTISLPATIKSSKEIKVFSITGELLIKTTAGESQVQIDCSKLKAGMYLVNVTFDGQSKSARFVKTY
jgi:hypothetical protein